MADKPEQANKETEIRRVLIPSQAELKAANVERGNDSKSTEIDRHLAWASLKNTGHLAENEAAVLLETDMLYGNNNDKISAEELNRAIEAAKNPDNKNPLLSSDHLMNIKAQLFPEQAAEAKEPKSR